MTGDSLKKSPHFAVVNNIIPNRNNNSFDSPATSTLLFIGGANKYINKPAIKKTKKNSILDFQ
jgi:hypothetical protein